MRKGSEGLSVTVPETDGGAAAAAGASSGAAAPPWPCAPERPPIILVPPSGVDWPSAALFGGQVFVRSATELRAFLRDGSASRTVYTDSQPSSATGLFVDDDGVFFAATVNGSLHVLRMTAEGGAVSQVDAPSSAGSAALPAMFDLVAADATSLYVIGKDASATARVIARVAKATGAVTELANLDLSGPSSLNVQVQSQGGYVWWAQPPLVVARVPVGAIAPSNGEQFLSSPTCTLFTVADEIYCPDNQYVVVFSRADGRMLANEPLPPGYSAGYGRTYVQGVRSPFLRVEPGRMVLAIGVNNGGRPPSYMNGIGVWDQKSNTMRQLACAEDTSIVYAVADDRQVVWMEEHAAGREVRTVAY